MLNRRHLREKVLQALYAYYHSGTTDVAQHEKNLLQSIDKIYEMYIWMLSLIMEIVDRTDLDAEERANKHLPTADDLNASRKLLSNSFIISLKKNKEYLADLKKYKIAWDFEPELAKTLFRSLKASPEYAEYLARTKDTLHSDKDIIKFIFKKTILKSELAQQAFEDKFITWPLDKALMQALVTKTFKNFAFDDPAKNKMAEVCTNWEDDKEFLSDLFKKTIDHNREYQQLISVKTQNWEPERIAMMDTLLMKMAISEFMEFPLIPVKVTINEYLEMSKEFSTPKSNAFINGILDKILAELRSEKKIVKTGRGLIDD